MINKTNKGFLIDELEFDIYGNRDNYYLIGRFMDENKNDERITIIVQEVNDEFTIFGYFVCKNNLEFLGILNGFKDMELP